MFINNNMAFKRYITTDGELQYLLRNYRSICVHTRKKRKKIEFNFDIYKGLLQTV